MKIENVHLVVFSPCGGTGRIVNALGRDITLPKTEHNLTLPENREKALSFKPNELVFLGFPVYGGRVPRNAERVFSSLNGEDTPCVLTAVYGNRAYEGALLDLHAAASARGFKPIAAVAAIAEHSIIPSIAAGRPDVGDAWVLAEFGLRILTRAEEDAPAIKAPGSYPEARPAGASIFPQTDTEICTRCGYCVTVCPSGAIPAKDPMKTNKDDCLLCAACVKFCPDAARALGTFAAREGIKGFLQKSAGERKEAELFLS